MMDGMHFVMDDTDKYTREEIAAFEATLAPEAKAEVEARIEAINDSFDNRRRNGSVMI